MTRLRAALLAFALAGCATADLVIRNPIVIDGTGAPARKVAAVVIDEGRIAQIAEDAMPRIRARVIDAEGMYLIPGLWDMHIHLFFAREASLPVLLAHGVTSARDMGGDLAESLEWKRRIARGELEGPRLFVAGPMLESPSALESARKRGVPESILEHHWPVATAAEATAVVERLANAGVDFIKARSFASPDVLRAIADAAARHGLRLAGHPLWSLEPAEAVRAGQASFEHGFYPWPPREDTSLAAEDVAVVPTLVAWEPRARPIEEVRAIVEAERSLPPELIANWRKGLADRERENREGVEGWRKVLDEHAREIGRQHRAGATVLPGTDLATTLVYPGKSLHEELALFVEKAGMTPMAALQSATRDAARFMGVGDRLGTIEERKEADMLLLSKNPLENIRNLDSTTMVWRAGVPVGRPVRPLMNVVEQQ